MNAINSILGPDSPNYVRFAVIFLIVALGVFLLWFVIRSVMKALRRGGLVGRSRQPRIGILEETEIDARRRLLLIRRDNVEHLILLGQNSDIVIEQNIIRAGQSTLIQPPVMAQPQKREPENNDDEINRNNYRNAAKAQARAAAQVAPRPQALPEPPPRIMPQQISQPEVAPPAVRQAPIEAQTRENLTLPQVNMGIPSRPNPFPMRPAAPQPQATEMSAAPKPPSSPFDNLENEMANLLGQTRPAPSPPK